MCCRHDMATSDDDVWGGDGEEEGPGEGGREAMDREWQARREEHYSSGYREGLEAGKHDTVQEGFNQGAPCPLHAVCVVPECPSEMEGASGGSRMAAGYRQGAAAGFECGAARGAAVTLRALAGRLPANLSGRLQEAQQQQQDGRQQLADLPYQQMQQRVCSSLMAVQPEGEQQQPPLPPDVAAAVQSSRSVLEQLGLQAPAQCHVVSCKPVE